MIKNPLCRVRVLLALIVHTTATEDVNGDGCSHVTLSRSFTETDASPGESGVLTSSSLTSPAFAPHCKETKDETFPPTMAPTPLCLCCDLDDYCEKVLIEGKMMAVCDWLQILPEEKKIRTCKNKQYKVLKNKDEACPYLRTFSNAFTENCNSSGKYTGGIDSSRSMALISIDYSEICARTCNSCNEPTVSIPTSNPPPVPVPPSAGPDAPLVTLDTNVFINEISSDSDELISVEIAAPVETDLTGWSLIAYKGRDGKTIASMEFSQFLVDDSEISDGVRFLTRPVPLLTAGFSRDENGYGLALVDPDGNTVQFISYSDKSIRAADGPANGLVSSNVGPFKSSSEGSGYSYSLQLTGTGNVASDFKWSVSTSGGTDGFLNSGQSIMGTDIFINEVTSDTGENFIEIAGPVETKMGGWSVVLYSSIDGQPYHTQKLSSLLKDNKGDSSGFGFGTYSINGMRRGGGYGLALVNTGGKVVQFISSGGSFRAKGGAAKGMTSINIGDTKSNTNSGYSFQLVGNGRKAGHFRWSGPIYATAGAINTGQMFAYAFINEIHYQNVEPSRRFVEIAMGSNTVLRGWKIVLYNGSNGLPYHSEELSTFSNADGFGFLAVQMKEMKKDGSYGVALIDSSSNVIQFLSYNGRFKAKDGLANDMVSYNIGGFESTATNSGHSFQLIGTGLFAGDFKWSSPIKTTEGAVNRGQSFKKSATKVRNGHSYSHDEY